MQNVNELHEVFTTSCTPLVVGSLVQGIIDVKHDDCLAVLVQSRYSAILPLLQLNDESDLAPADFDRLQVGNYVTCVILEYSGEKIILSMRYSFITNRLTIPRTTQSIQPKTRTYVLVLMCRNFGLVKKLATVMI